MAKKTNKEEKKEFTAHELEEQVVSLANAGHSPSKIGIILRDEYGVRNFSEVTNKKIQEVLRENELVGDMPEDLLNLIRRSVILSNHLNKNKKDYSAKRGYELTVAKIRKLTKYYAKKNRIPKGWVYTPEQAALLVR
ncbi:MAG: 30S ribosomal protein S15 [Candidatus Iainarchaeum sp.]|jgi:ribosomal protein S15P/S13E|nr:MAG: 30S ribosomal protein S15 [archaeon ADurb.Bin336]